MAKRKKMYNYEFADCNQVLPSSVVIKCTASGESVRMYHKLLVKLIQKKYKNRWDLFNATYVKKGNKVARPTNQQELDDYNARPERYRKYLITTYLSYKRDLTISVEERLNKLSFINMCYSKRWGTTIESNLINI